MCYVPVPRGEIVDKVAHLRELFRKIAPANEQEHRAHERREVLTKNLLSNLVRTKEHPTLKTVLDVGDSFSLTLDGSHRLFGYTLDEIRESDFQLNSGRTHIIESYPFNRDLPIDLPSRLGTREVFREGGTLHDLVPGWQTDIPIRVLDEAGWQQPGTFYVRVGTEDSLGSSLPPGAVALVEPIGKKERLRPDLRAIYLLQFGNGYRCSRCLVVRDKLMLMISGKHFTSAKGTEEFSYPGTVRIAGRIRAFALSLPVPDYPLLGSLPASSHNAQLVMPWEHPSWHQFFTAKRRRFPRSAQERPHIRDVLEASFRTRLSGRTERRYRHPTGSLPHIDTLIQLSLENAARYTDVLRAQGCLRSDRGKFSLDTLLNTGDLADVVAFSPQVSLPVPDLIWQMLRNEFGEWPPSLSVAFPQLRSLDDRVVRLPQCREIHGLEPSLSSGTLVLLEKVSEPPDTQSDARKIGWSRPMYALRRGTEIFCGYLKRDDNLFALFTDTQKKEPEITFFSDELPQLSLVSGIAVPV